MYVKKLKVCHNPEGCTYIDVKLEEKRKRKKNEIPTKKHSDNIFAPPDRHFSCLTSLLASTPFTFVLSATTHSALCLFLGCSFSTHLSFVSVPCSMLSDESFSRTLSWPINTCMSIASASPTLTKPGPVCASHGLKKSSSKRVLQGSV